MFFDELIKDSNANKVKANFEAEKDESLNLDSKLIRGGIELSRENGELKAVGINHLGVKEVVNTMNKFEEFHFALEDDKNNLLSILKNALKKWRK